MRTNTFSAIILALALLCSWGSAGAQCIDYDEYLHWVGYLQTENWAFTLAVSGDFAYIPNSGLLVVDISDPATPQIVNSIFPSLGSEDMATSGNYLYMPVAVSMVFKLSIFQIL